MKKKIPFLKSTQTFLTKHCPEILTGIGIAGMVGTTVLAVRATPKALKLIDEEKKEKKVSKLSAGEVIKTTWKLYVPSVVTGAASVACLIGANSVHTRRHAALAAAYKISEAAMTEYREKVVETIGEKKEKEVREKVDKAIVDRNPVANAEVIETGRGNTLCYDGLTERTFRSDRDAIVRAINEVNRKMNLESYVSLNDLYRELDLWPSKIGDIIGWKADWGMIEPCFSTQLSNDGEPALVLGFYNPPKYGYDQ